MFSCFSRGSSFSRSSFSRGSSFSRSSFSRGSSFSRSSFSRGSSFSRSSFSRGSSVSRSLVFGLRSSFSRHPLKLLYFTSFIKQSHQKFMQFRKIPIISPELILNFCSKDCFAGLIFRGAYFQRNLLLEGILHFKMGCS